MTIKAELAKRETELFNTKTIANWQLEKVTAAEMPWWARGAAGEGHDGYYFYLADMPKMVFSAVASDDTPRAWLQACELTIRAFENINNSDLIGTLATDDPWNLKGLGVEVTFVPDDKVLTQAIMPLVKASVVVTA